MPKKVTKAVIVAAGLGKRMFPFTKIDSKLLIPIINKPIVVYLMQELHESGITDVLIVTNHTNKLKEFFTKNQHLNKILKKIEREDLIRYLYEIENLCKIQYIKQNEPRGWVHAVLKAKDFIKDEPFVVLFSDLFYKSKIPAAKQVIDLFYKKNKSILSSGRYVFKPSVFKLISNFEFPLGGDWNSEHELFNKLKEKNDFFWYTFDGPSFSVGEPMDFLKTLLTITLEDQYYSRRLISIIQYDKKFKRDINEFYQAIKSENKFIRKRINKNNERKK
ncbi:NTP transferase domain-containing protein [Candidatus Woesearchaeota archaeon]|nr:NTP transferase domain-containing protein [Candidatus Woesearchaeota archaeon]